MLFAVDTHLLNDINCKPIHVLNFLTEEQNYVKCFQKNVSIQHLAWHVYFHKSNILKF